MTSQIIQEDQEDRMSDCTLKEPSKKLSTTVVIEQKGRHFLVKYLYLEIGHVRN